VSFLSLGRAAPQCGRRAAAALLAGPCCIDLETPWARELQPISASVPRWRHMQCPWQTRRALHSRHGVASRSPSQPTGATHAKRVWRPPLPSALNRLTDGGGSLRVVRSDPSRGAFDTSRPASLQSKSPAMVRAFAPTESTATGRSHACTSAVVTKPWAHTTSISGLYGWQEIASTPVVMSKRAIFDTTALTTVSCIFNRCKDQITRSVSTGRTMWSSTHTFLFCKTALQKDMSQTPQERMRKACGRRVNGSMKKPCTRSGCGNLHGQLPERKKRKKKKGGAKKGLGDIFHCRRVRSREREGNRANRTR